MESVIPQLAVLAGICGVMAATLGLARIALGPDVEPLEPSEERRDGSDTKAA